MGWHIIEKLVEQGAEHSTLVGKFWVTFFFVLRFLIVVSIADNVFGDEQDNFVCNTETPGCANVCFNEFSPISLVQLWALQILCASLPMVVFMVYVAHKLEKISQAKKLRQEEQEKEKERREKAKKTREANRVLAIEDGTRISRQGSGPPEYNALDDPLSDKGNDDENKKDKGEKKEKKDDDDDDKVVATQLNSDTPSTLLLVYVAQVLIRLFIEIGFMVAQFNIYVYKFWVPELFKCARFPCPNVVDCYVSRPKEKTVILWIMFGTGLMMIVVNIVELVHLGTDKIAEAWKNRHHDITKQYKISNHVPHFGSHHGADRYDDEEFYDVGYSVGKSRHRGRRRRRPGYPRGYPRAVGIRVGYARSSLSGEDGNDFDGDHFM